MQHKPKKTHTTKMDTLSPTSPKPTAAVDSVIYSIIDNALKVLLVKRQNPPFENQWSLVGGFVDLEQDQSIEQTAKRKLKQKTGVDTPYLEQLYTIGNQSRDPRGWSITTVYFALIPSQGVILQAGNGSIDIKWATLNAGKIDTPLAFDHSQILEDCTQRLKNKVLYTSLPLYLMPKKFTLNELQTVYEIIIDKKMDPKSFRRRMLNANILEETGDLKQTGKRPAMLYQPKQSEMTHFFMRNIEGQYQA